jgi:hypothetical protein
MLRPLHVRKHGPMCNLVRRMIILALYKCYDFHKPNFYYCLILTMSRESAVGIATCYGLEKREVGVRVPVGTIIFSSLCRSDWFWGPPNLLSYGYWGLFPSGVKRPGREADDSPQTSAEVKKNADLRIRSLICLHDRVLN